MGLDAGYPFDLCRGQQCPGSTLDAALLLGQRQNRPGGACFAGQKQPELGTSPKVKYAAG